MEELPVVMPDVVFDGILSAAELWGGSGSVHHQDQQAFKLYKVRIKNVCELLRNT